MKRSKLLFKLLPGLIMLTLSINLSAQCDNWEGSAQKGEAEDAHTIYRQALKTKDYQMAFENWEKAYNIAPAADGKRDFHYTDGIKLYLNRWKNETDAAKKKEYIDRILKLQEEAVNCLSSGGITLKCHGQKDCYTKRIGYLQGRLAYDMFYILNTPYSKTIEQLSGAVENSGDDLEYIVFAPYANIVVYNFENELMTKEEARAIYERLNAVADLKIAKGDRLSDSYQQAKQSMNSTFSKIERYIFDCEFFKAKLRPEYDADPDNFEVIKQTLAILKGQGCGSGDVFFDELDTKWKKYAAVENAKIQADFEENNPNVAAKRLYDQGDFKSAALKYQEAADGEADPSKKAGYLFSLASIEFRKLKQYSKARATAREAAKLRPGWGRPFMLIGDMYGSTARSCGDSWNQRLAILAAMDKYNYAKSIDSEQAKDANSRLSKYRASMPDKNDGFMRGIKVGHAASVGCWIGETVKVRFSN